MKSYTIIIAFIFLCVGSTLLRADVIYTWQDDNGVIHFTNIQPPETPAQVSKYLEVSYKSREEPYETEVEEAATDDSLPEAAELPQPVVRQEETDTDAEAPEGEIGIEPAVYDVETDVAEVAEIDSDNTLQTANSVGIYYNDRYGYGGYVYYDTHRRRYYRPHGKYRYYRPHKKHRYYKHRRYRHKKYYPGTLHKPRYRKPYKHAPHYRKPHYDKKPRVIRPGVHRHGRHPRPGFGIGIRIKHRR
ncbi:hypothetical protein DENIS_2769 [Desulfonema ishimotonii]|uniref:DUF4124 domain-containing protein n=1 Tax=Desulfonema ishimotonii TaxID=45657 RepID=A0A401FXV6_9BACT|nr:DUF4124 domain-containing protein [Desulfonema ishimotonii]GBC61807.1 hypothetical protein DENIS_2769 [Desulfonema ishimotonii]